MPAADYFRLHHRAAFELRSTRPANGSWARILDHIRNWLARKAVSSGDLWKPWLAEGGIWRSPGGRAARIETRAIEPLNGGPVPAWALRLEHPDFEQARRTWRVDVGMETRSTGAIAFSISTAWRLDPDWVGEDLPAPRPSSPVVVKELLRDPSLEARSGCLKLASCALPLRTGQGEYFRDLLAATDRGCPVICASFDKQTGKPLLDADVLAQQLAGAAAVVVPVDLKLDEELAWSLPEEFRCAGGTVRVYQPGVRFQVNGDGWRHRYVPASELRRRPPEEWQDILVVSVARRARLPAAGEISTLEDVDSRRRELALAQLAAQHGQADGMLKLYEQDNEDLRKKTKERDVALNEARNRIADLEQAVEKAKDDLKNDSWRREDAESRLKSAQRDMEGLRAQAEALRRLEEFPSSLEKVLDFVEAAFPGRIYFHKRARESARKCSFSDLDKAWRMLRAMATLLYEYYFEEKLVLKEICTRFKNASGFELAVGESEGTMNVARLADQRILEHDGVMLNISTHVKSGSRPKDCLRVHYAALSAERKIIVGHCGDHLETRATN
ncbi:MAG: hypothetical protein IT452_05190 [Planctomycetia bacterium]|nr:hypothetical protein [Planctomycetia bacterium]